MCVLDPRHYIYSVPTNRCLEFCLDKNWKGPRFTLSVKIASAAPFFLIAFSIGIAMLLIPIEIVQVGPSARELN